MESVEWGEPNYLQLLLGSGLTSDPDLSLFVGGLTPLSGCLPSPSSPSLPPATSLLTSSISTGWESWSSIWLTVSSSNPWAERAVPAHLSSSSYLGQDRMWHNHVTAQDVISLYENTGCDVTHLDCETTGRKKPSCSVTKTRPTDFNKTPDWIRLMMMSLCVGVNLRSHWSERLWSGLALDSTPFPK